ncbi:MAG: type II secretion system F family protein [Mariprofundales bacterium]
MSLYAYEALDARGKRKRAEIEASSEQDARIKLKAQSLVPRKITALASSHKKTIGHTNSKNTGTFSRSDTVFFLQQISILLDAGMPLVEALSSISSGMSSIKARRLCGSIRQQVLAGTPLAESLVQHQFDETICNMIAAGEETGQLQTVTNRLADLLEQREEMRQQVMSAILYPAIVTGFGLLVITFLLVFVVPQVVGVFSHAKAELPFLTVALISLSDFVRHQGLLLLVVIGSLFGSYKLMMRSEAWRTRRDALWLRIPVISGLIQRIQTASFTRTLGMLLQGGVPVLTALHIASQSLSILPMRNHALKAREALREGESLADCLKASGVFPYLAVRLIAVGEQSGRLDEMLLKVAHTFDEESKRSLKRAVTLLEPILILAMALIVGALAMAILLPIMEMNELVG